ncbi:MAG TPA: sulfotransferase [Caulobacteraceae bacterium]|nr:sulfotransferase [Caulobacteraceae bacterium]
MKSPLSLNEAINGAAALLASEPAQAQSHAEAILKGAPDDPRVLLILASAHRRQGAARSAHALLAPLAKAWPRAARTHYELGLVLSILGDTTGAIAALRRAVGLDHDLAGAWRALGDVLFATGDVTGADNAYAEHDRSAIEDPALRPAADDLFNGRLIEAETRLMAHLRVHPADLSAAHLLAEAFLRQERLDEAESLFAHVLEREPGQDATRFNYARALFRRQAAAEALDQMRRLLATDPNNSAYRNLTAACLALAGRHDEALVLYEGLLADFPNDPRIWLNKGHALRTIRRPDDAVAAYRHVIELAPQFGEAYSSLADLKTAPLTARDEADMAAQLARADIEENDRLHLHYALGKALEDRGAHQDAFAHYAGGARIRRKRLVYHADAATALIRRHEALFTQAFFEARGEGGSTSDAPIFIVGLPRSGSTLIEQILASHSAVEGTMELPDIGVIAGSLRGAKTQDSPARRYPEASAELGVVARTTWGDRYIERTAIHRRLGRPFFIDKMPNNFHHIGLIQLILPKARIIDARRHPMAACFSTFKQHFAQGQTFSYDLTDLGRYYRDYVELTAHFDEVLPGRVHRVIYEDMVEDTEGEVRRLLDHCGLPFEASCLKFHENDRAVRTVSSEQVRRPIFRDGLEQWRRYEAWLGPLEAALGPALKGWRGAAFTSPPASRRGSRKPPP